ncbi:MAG: hypothetical protein FRX49_12289 [Trebouxia sp. A1-2]|nr:MAG: hypothetical protein FRX49_12289 [Trebouxia sp. A1-2]
MKIVDAKDVYDHLSALEMELLQSYGGYHPEKDIIGSTSNEYKAPKNKRPQLKTRQMLGANPTEPANTDAQTYTYIT